jgi:uncharacterized protein YcbK (DUF882 family)
MDETPFSCSEADSPSAHSDDCPCCVNLSRRSWFRAALGLAAGAATLACTPAALAAGHSERRLRLYNVNTNEAFDGIYWRNGRYLPPAMTMLNQILRDHRANEATRMDPELFDLLHAVADRSGSDEFFHVISAYRTPETNHAKVLQSRRVAKNSQHMEGKALDLRLPDYSSDGIAKIALAMSIGGVGLYRRDGFVHLDTGEPRQWGATPGARRPPIGRASAKLRKPPQPVARSRQAPRR